MGGIIRLFVGFMIEVGAISVTCDDEFVTLLCVTLDLFADGSDFTVVGVEVFVDIMLVDVADLVVCSMNGDGVKASAAAVFDDSVVAVTELVISMKALPVAEYEWDIAHDVAVVLAVSHPIIFTDTDTGVDYGGIPEFSAMTSKSI